MIEGLLCARSSSLEDCIESAGVLAQITSPWIADNHKIEDLDRHVPAMVAALTGGYNVRSLPTNYCWKKRQSKFIEYNLYE